MSKFIGIVLSAGKGKRMGTKISKQYLEIKGKPVLYYTLKAFEESEIDEIIVVTGKDDFEYVINEIIEKYKIKKVVCVTEGGAERYDSVINGIKCVDKMEKENIYTLIHDGARPLIKPQDINRIMKGVEECDAVVAAMPVKDTIKIVDDENMVSSTPLRKYVWQIQTPQAFEYELIKKAYDKMKEANDTTITDDSMVVEKYTDHKVKVIETGYYNIKITTPEDIDIMEKYLEK